MSVFTSECQRHLSRSESSEILTSGAIKKGTMRYREWFNLQRLAAMGIPVELGVIFGSHARGEASQWSDIDLLVISPRFDGPRTREEINPLWRIATREDSRIEPIPCGSVEGNGG